MTSFVTFSMTKEEQRKKVNYSIDQQLKQEEKRYDLNRLSKKYRDMAKKAFKREAYTEEEKKNIEKKYKKRKDFYTKEYKKKLKDQKTKKIVLEKQEILKSEYDKMVPMTAAELSKKKKNKATKSKFNNIKSKLKSFFGFGKSSQKSSPRTSPKQQAYKKENSSVQKLTKGSRTKEYAESVKKVMDFYQKRGKRGRTKDIFSKHSSAYREFIIQDVFKNL